MNEPAIASRHGVVLPICTLLAWALAFVLLRNIPLSHDVVGQLWIARQLLGGTHLYSQIIEVNPPLWFWIAVPVQRLAEGFGLSPARTMVALVFVLIGASLALLSLLLAGQTARTRAVLLAAALLALLIVPLRGFAQREHLCLIGALPYVVLAARRAEGRDTPWPLAVMTGLIAAFGFALKHYFLLVPLVLEFWLFHVRRKQWTPLRPEILALGAVGALYAVAVVEFAPEFLSRIVPILRLAYDGYGFSLPFVAAQAWVAGWAFGGAILILERATAPQLTIAAGWTAFAFAIVYFLQAKGWDYQAFPATGAMLFAIASLLPDRAAVRRGWVAMAGLVGAMVLLLAPAVRDGPYRNDSAAPVTELLKGDPPGSTAAILTGTTHNIWPMIDELGMKWPSRYLSFWMVYTIAKYQREHGALAPGLNALADSLRRDTVDDFLCNPPLAILVDDMRNSPLEGFDILAFFRENDAFRQLFSHYDQGRAIGDYTRYDNRRDWHSPRPADCRSIF